MEHELQQDEDEAAFVDSFFLPGGILDPEDDEVEPKPGFLGTNVPLASNPWEERTAERLPVLGLESMLIGSPNSQSIKASFTATTLTRSPLSSVVRHGKPLLPDSVVSEFTLPGTAFDTSTSTMTPPGFQQTLVPPSTPLAPRSNNEHHSTVKSSPMQLQPTLSGPDPSSATSRKSYASAVAAKVPLAAGPKSPTTSAIDSGFPTPPRSVTARSPPTSSSSLSGHSRDCGDTSPSLRQTPPSRRSTVDGDSEASPITSNATNLLLPRIDQAPKRDVRRSRKEAATRHDLVEPPDLSSQNNLPPMRPANDTTTKKTGTVSTSHRDGVIMANGRTPLMESSIHPLFHGMSLRGLLGQVAITLYEVLAPLVLQPIQWAGALFVTVAKALIVVALALSNVVKHAMEQMAKRDASCLCYLICYLNPYICDFAMSNFTLPLYFPHLFSVSCILFITVGDSSGPSLKSTRSSTWPDKLSEDICRKIVTVMQWIIFVYLFCSGLEDPNLGFMMRDGPVRMIMAYEFSLLRARLVLSPIAWVSWSMQILIAFYLPSNVLTVFSLFVLGMASIRLSSLLQNERST